MNFVIEGIRYVCGLNMEDKNCSLSHCIDNNEMRHKNIDVLPQNVIVNIYLCKERNHYGNIS